MSEIYIKQKIKFLLKRTLLTNPRITSEAEVDRYNYATKLGKLEHIDYAIPLFGYASEADKDPSAIYSLLKRAVIAEFPCQVEFVNGYLNIMFTSEFLASALQSQLDAAAIPRSSEEQIVLLQTSTDSQTATATKILQECLRTIGIVGKATNPFPGKATAAGQYSLESDEEIRRTLGLLPGVIQETDSKAVYIQTKNDSHALCSAKGGWYALAFIVAALKESDDIGKRAFLVGSSGINKLIKDVFPDSHTLDVNLHAKHLDETFHRPVQKLLGEVKHNFRTQNIKNLGTKQRRQLLYVLDFEYEISEAVKLGDLKRIIGEVTTLFKQHPFANVT